MYRNEAVRLLRQWDEQGKYIFTKHQLAKIFIDDNKKALDEGLCRLVKNHVLRRACRGVYVNEYARCTDRYTIERVALALRRGHYNYLSLESMLSEYGVISQIPADQMTVMTTGRRGIYDTPYGTIEFTHTDRTLSQILTSFISLKGRPLRLATEKAAIRDLKRVGRNVQLIDEMQDEKGQV